jgi:hypothetical protein
MMGGQMRMLLVLGFLIFAIVLGFFIFIVWVNGASEKVVLPFFKAAFLPLIAAAGLLLYDLLLPLPKKTLDIPVLILRNDSYQLLPLLNHVETIGHSTGEGYWRLNTLSFIWRDKAEKIGPLPPQDELPFFYSDLLELAVWQWIGETFPIHWQVERRFFRGISSAGGSIKPKGDFKRQTIKTPDEIANLLKGNSLLPIMKDHLRPIFLPEGTIVSVDRSNGRRTYEFRNEYALFEITIEIAGGEQVGAGKVADALRSSHNLQGTWANHFFVGFRFSPDRLRRWSSEVEKQDQWVSQIMELFQEAFDWNLIRAEIERCSIVKP